MKILFKFHTFGFLTWAGLNLFMLKIMPYITLKEFIISNFMIIIAIILVLGIQINITNMKR